MGCKLRCKIIYEQNSIKMARYSFQEIQEYNSLTLPNVVFFCFMQQISEYSLNYVSFGKTKLVATAYEIH